MTFFCCEKGLWRMNDHHDQIIQTHFFQSLINTLGCRLIGLMLRSDLRYDKKLLSRHTTGSDTFTDTALITVSLRCINMTVARCNSSPNCICRVRIINKPCSKSKLWYLHTVVQCIIFAQNTHQFLPKLFN
ncbi:unknown [Lachnospira eligens CAG:72]|uniref:Uncharacterized protein n=1 Tax=Lachnospira eligens CAG:72 TaxID=1263077 RepID=R5ZUT5_9FIRM|nr:unknown [[Eubacterium] eligens CAG:72]